VDLYRAFLEVPLFCSTVTTRVAHRKQPSVFPAFGVLFSSLYFLSSFAAFRLLVLDIFHYS
jgi:hypothetical protein